MCIHVVSQSSYEIVMFAMIDHFPEIFGSGFASPRGHQCLRGPKRFVGDGSRGLQSVAGQDAQRDGGRFFGASEFHGWYFWWEFPQPGKGKLQVLPPNLWLHCKIFVHLWALAGIALAQMGTTKVINLDPVQMSYNTAISALEYRQQLGERPGVPRGRANP